MGNSSAQLRQPPLQGHSGSTTASQLPATTPAPVSDDERTVISNRAPAALVGAGMLDLTPGGSLVGERLDHFELQEFVGGGGMGVVYKALDTRLNRIVALKVLSRDQADEEEKVRRFQNEAQSAARLDHDHIARVYFVGQDRGLHYIVFEYIEGINLRDLVARKGPLPLDEAVSYTLQIAEALAHAASRDVVHRDIKPSNVLITSQGRAKLVDMGLARLHQVEPSDNDLTSSGVTLGTFDYISPEQARDPRSADVRSDIYSLGCTTYYMLTARPPFPEGNVLQKLLQHNNDPPPDPAEYNPELPDQVSRLIRKMLAKDPRRRHQSAGELVSDLLVLTEQLGLPTANVDPLAWSVATPPRITFIERHLPWLAPLVILVATVIAMEVVWRPDAAGLTEPSAPMLPRPGRPSGQSTHSAPSSIGATLPPETITPAGRAAQDVPPALPPVAHVPMDRASSPEPPAPETVPAAATAANDATAVPAVASASQSLRAEASDNGSLTIADSALDAELGVGRVEGQLSATAAVVAAESPGRAVPAAPVTPRLGVRIVSPEASTLNAVGSLRRACAEAISNDVIELHFNGRLTEKPFRISNKTLTIRAGEGYSPTIAFEPASAEPQAMLTIAGGQLTLVNVAVEVDIPTRFDPPGWALFQTQRANLLRLQDCWLTVRNATEHAAAQHPNVAFFDIRAAADTGAMAMENGALAEQSPVNIQLQNCIARGEATLLRCEELQPVNLGWQNGLLATSERLLVAKGGEMPNRTNGQITLDLRHVTAHAKSGLCLISNAEGSRPLLHTELTCTDSILLSAADSSLLDQSGVSSVEDFESKVKWNGNRYFYSGFDTFWRISSSTMATLTPDAIRRSFDDWQRHWKEALENQDSWNRVVWKRLPEASRPMHTHVPADYALDESSTENQARLLGATDGTEAGFQAADLPTVFPAGLIQTPAAATPPQESM